MKKLLKITILILSLVYFSSAQNIDIEVAKFVKMIDSGAIEKAAEESAKLIADNPNHPGVLYLKGRLSTDGIEALKFYQAIVDNFPKSEWADDALYKIYQYYYAVGLYRTADLKWKHLQKEYPNSPYLSSPISKDLGDKRDEYTETSQKDTPAVKPTIKMVEQPKPIDIPQQQVVQFETQTNIDVFTVQVGAFSTIENAKKQEKFFVELGYPVEVTNKIRAGKSLYLVWVGNFNTMDEAIKLKNEIKQKFNIESITVQKY